MQFNSNLATRHSPLVTFLPSLVTPTALAASKAIIRASHTWTEDEMWEKQQAYIGPVFTSNDAREGATAFAEKRKPNWQGN